MFYVKHKRNFASEFIHEWKSHGHRMSHTQKSSHGGVSFIISWQICPQIKCLHVLDVRERRRVPRESKMQVPYFVKIYKVYGTLQAVVSPGRTLHYEGKETTASIRLLLWSIRRPALWTNKLTLNM